MRAALNAVGFCSWILISAVAAAQGSTAVVAVGDCHNTELTRAAKDFGEALKQQPGVGVLEMDGALAKLGLERGRSVQEVQRQLVVVEDHFYRAQYAKMVSQLQVVFDDIPKLPPGRARWQLYAAAWTLEALARSHVKKRGSVEEAYERVLRLDPAYKLDPDYVAPSMLELFEQTKKALAQKKRHRLSITSQPSGATVYIDGKEIPGKTTPMLVELLPGDYALSLSKGERFSFPRQIVVPVMRDYFVDLGFESAIEAGRALCLHGPFEEQARLSAASRLGSLLEVDRIVALRLDTVKGQPVWLTATSLLGSTKAREGGVEASEQNGIKSTDLSALARFILTGETSNIVRKLPRDVPVELAVPSPVTVGPAPAPWVPPTPVVLSPSESEPLRITADDSWKRPTGVGSLVGGGATVATGILFFVLSGSASSSFDRISEGGIPPERAGEARRALDSANLYRTLGFVATGLGVAALGTGTYLLLSAKEHESSMISFQGGPGGGLVQFSASWP